MSEERSFISDLRSPAATATQDEAAFVLCIENNETRDQALLLIESIRTFTGRFARSPIFAVAPRSGLGVDVRTRARLEALEVTYYEEPLNALCPEYGSANRLYAAAWAATATSAETLFVLDSDTLFLGEPEPLSFHRDLALRPVDVKGSASSGPGDPFEPYWTALCELIGFSIQELPWVETVLDGQRVRASYNGGYAVVRRASGILERAAEIFSLSLRAGLRPYKDQQHRVFASTGEVSPLAAEYWGSNQAAFSIAAWSKTRRVQGLDRRHNVPLHGLADPAHWNESWIDVRPLHVHYHWLLREENLASALRTLAKLGIAEEQLGWIEERAPIEKPRQRRAPAPPAVAAGVEAQPLLICGMHRSATSLVASVLRRAGLDLGDDLLGPGPGNRLGHFEDQAFWQLHEDMLEAGGSTALSVGDDFMPPEGEIFRRRAQALIESRQGRGFWGFKDPRTCLFLEFWQELLPQANYVVLYRHPVEVAISLRRRGTEKEVRLDPWAGIRAFEVYNKRLLTFLEKHRARCYLAQVPALTEDLPQTLRQLGSKLGLSLRSLEAPALFAAEELTSYGELANESERWEALIPEALAIYRRLEALADLPSRPISQEVKSLELPSQPRRALEDFFQDLEATREASRAPNWHLAESLRRLEKTQAQLAKSQDQLRHLELERAQTEALYLSAASRGDELAATLTAIEKTRGFGLLSAWWRLMRRS